jgi:hypothetical protein
LSVPLRSASTSANSWPLVGGSTAASIELFFSHALASDPIFALLLQQDIHDLHCCHNTKPIATIAPAQSITLIITPKSGNAQQPSQ